jgi:hypothetical protein
MPQLEEIAIRLKDARLRLEAARDNLKQVIAERLGGPDGSYAYHQAVRRENAALQDFAQVLREYRDSVINDGHAECPECKRLMGVLKAENQILAQIHGEEIAATIQNDTQAFEALAPHVRRVRIRRDTAARNLKAHIAQHIA